MSYFVVQFPLITEIYQEAILNKRFKIAQNIYNGVVNVTQKRYQEMIKTKSYRELLSSLSNNIVKDKVIWKEISKIRKQFHIDEYSFYNDVKKMQHHFKDNIDAFTAQKIASTVWKSYDALLFGNGKKVYYKRKDELSSLEGKSNKTGIRFINRQLVWKGLVIPACIDEKSLYEYESLKLEIAYCRILRKFVKNKFHYYVQIVFKGKPPIKINQITGKAKHSMGEGDVGLDIGTSTIAIASKTNVSILELADKVQTIENIKRQLLRKMDRSRRMMNPNSFNDDGTIKKQGNKKVVWIQSNHYKECRNNLRELLRKQKDTRKYQHECLANYIISLGEHIYVETMNFKGLQKRSTKTEVSKKTGRINRKKRFGKSLGNRAPAMLLSIIDRKLKCFDKELMKINTCEAKASQFNHIEEVYKKKKLSQRWNNFNGIKIQRDMYSAYLIMNINKDLSTFNMDKCNERFSDFLELHDKEVKRLTGNRNLGSISIS